MQLCRTVPNARYCFASDPARRREHYRLHRDLYFAFDVAVARSRDVGLLFPTGTYPPIMSARAA
jgi:hypothetical protein